jgi:hypothetical protein
MGHLDQPLNTFWQLLFRRPGDSLWTDQASALAVATNGGLLLAAGGGKSLAVGIRPTNALEYSPLIVTSDARSWSPAGPVAALADEPSAFEKTGGGQALALVREGRTAQVLESTKALANWRTVTTETALASSRAARACGLTSLTAVGFAAGRWLIGASCRREGVVGLFDESGGAWHLVGPRLPRSVSRLSADVLGLQTTTGGLCALVGLTRSLGAGLVVACTNDARLSWRVSPAVALAGPETTVGFGPVTGAGVFAWISGPKQPESLAILNEPDMTWKYLPLPPPRTATLVFGPAGRVDALVVDDTLLTDWRLVANSRRWARVQELRVAIQFGSSG